MKLKRTLIQLCLLAMVCMIPTQLLAQIPPKPRIQTSASPEETAVYMPKGKNAAANSAKQEQKASKASKGKKEAPKAKKAPLTNRYSALKTNLAYDAFAVLNLAYEIQVHQRMSVEIPVMWSFWDLEQEHALRVVALQPELRWWMGQAVGKGHFFGLHANVAWFNAKWDEDRYQTYRRPLLGAGLSYGYKLPLSEHWGAEFTLGLGYANMKYNTYYNVDNGAQLGTRTRHYWGPTKVGVSLVYRF